MSGSVPHDARHTTHDTLLDCCRSIHKMTSEIGEALRSNDRGMLLAKLRERQSLIEEMGSLQSPSALLPDGVRGGVGEGGTSPLPLSPSPPPLVSLSPLREEESGEGMEEIKTLLQAILSLDDVHKEQIAHKREEISQQLRKLYDGRQLLRSSYMTFPSSGTKLIDVG